MKKITELFTQISGFKLTELTPKSLDDYAYFQNHFLCKDLNLTPGLINNCFWRLQEMIDNYEKCAQNKGICHSQNQHWTPYYYYGQIMFQTVSCPFDKQTKIQKVYLRNFLYHSFIHQAADILNENRFSPYQKRFFEALFTRINAKGNNKIGFYLHGPSGCGKSFVCLCAANFLVQNNYKVIYLNIPDLQNLLHQSFNQMQKKNCYEKLQNDLSVADYLFLDDLGAEKGTTYFYNVCLLPLLEKRLGKYNVVFISNFSFEEYFQHLQKAYVFADKIIERIKQQLCKL